jgi:hypothetical protein
MQNWLEEMAANDKYASKAAIDANRRNASPAPPPKKTCTLYVF